MILVTGATGSIGTELVPALAAAGRPVRALARTRAGGPPAGVEWVTGDLNRPDALPGLFDGVRAVYLLPGLPDLPGLLATARRAGVERVVLVSGGSAALADLDNVISRMMTLAERAVRAAGPAWTILRPRMFMSNTLRWVPQLVAGNEVRVPFAGVRSAVVDPYDIAAVAAEALLGDGHEGRVYDLTGPRALLPAERLATLAAVLGRPLRLRALTDEEAREELGRTMPAHFVDAQFRFFADGVLDEARVHPAVREITGREPRTFEQWARAHAAAFSPAPAA